MNDQHVKSERWDHCSACAYPWPCREALVEQVAAERAAREAAERDVDHALVTVGAFRKAIEDILEKAEGSATDDGVIRFYTLPTGPLHKAIGMARGTDAGGKFLVQLAVRDQQLAALREGLADLLESHDLLMGPELNLPPMARDIVRGVFLGGAAHARALLAPPARED